MGAPVDACPKGRGRWGRSGLEFPHPAGEIPGVAVLNVPHLEGPGAESGFHSTAVSSRALCKNLNFRPVVRVAPCGAGSPLRFTRALPYHPRVALRRCCLRSHRYGFEGIPVVVPLRELLRGARCALLSRRAVQVGSAFAGLDQKVQHHHAHN